MPRNERGSIHVHRSRLAALSAGALLFASSVVVPAATVAVDPPAGTIKVLDAPTYAPGATGQQFTVHVVANGSVDISGAGTGLTFDKTKLTLTALAKDATEVANGAAYAGFPSAGTIAAFIAAANANGSIPVIGWSYFDGSSFEPANADHGIFSATFTVKALGDSTLTVAVGNSGGILNGTDPGGAYGSALTVSTVDGQVVNPAPPAPPTPHMTALPAWAATNGLTIKWSATPGANPVASYDVRYRRAGYDGAYGTYTAWQNATAATQAAFTTAPGSTYCFSVRARDTMALVSGYSAETCSAAPLDERSLVKSGSWAAVASSVYYRSTGLKSTSTAAKLTRSGVQAKRIAIVVTTCPACGSVKVYWGATLLKTVSLKSATTVNKKVISIVAWTTVKSGTLVLKPGTAGRQTLIDGVVVTRN
jgi:hypothetical protein